MKIIHLTHPHQLQEELQPTVMALGYFDGVHLGHQQVIQTAKRMADERKMQSAVMTFHPHPSVVLGRGVQHVQYITPLVEKARLLKEIGVDLLYVVAFTPAFAALSPEQFIEDYIIGLRVKHVVAGFDFTYGRFGKGTMETMRFHARGEFTQTMIEKVAFHDEKVSSTLLRTLICEGRVDEIPDVLGRMYTVTGVVVDGDKRGRKIGFPTANVSTGDYLLPATGVYAVQMKVKDTWYEGVCNVGYKPTFQQNEKKISVEVHLFNFEADIYGQEVTVVWCTRIREEQKFNGIDALVAQIEKDKVTAQQFFAK